MTALAEEASVVSVRTLFVSYARKNQPNVRALENVSVDIPHAALIGLCGPSGCGKSTLARCIAGWQQPTAGEVIRRGPVQLVMQDPGASLNPRFTAREIVEEPLRIVGTLRDAPGMVNRLLRRVGFSDGIAQKRSTQFSGGERARLAIARALAAMNGARGGLLILDESLAALDVATRNGILALLQELRLETGLALLLASHDPEMLAHSVDRVVRMAEGRVMA